MYYTNTFQLWLFCLFVVVYRILGGVSEVPGQNAAGRVWSLLWLSCLQRLKVTPSPFMENTEKKILKLVIKDIDLCTFNIPVWRIMLLCLFQFIIISDILTNMMSSNLDDILFLTQECRPVMYCWGNDQVVAKLMISISPYQRLLRASDRAPGAVCTCRCNGLGHARGPEEVGWGGFGAVVFNQSIWGMRNGLPTCLELPVYLILRSKCFLWLWMDLWFTQGR